MLILLYAVLVRANLTIYDHSRGASGKRLPRRAYRRIFARDIDVDRLPAFFSLKSRNQAIVYAC